MSIRRKSLLQNIDQVLKENSSNQKPPQNRRSALRDTASRLNRPLAASSLLQPLPELDDEDSNLQLEQSIKPTGLLNEEDSSQNVAFGFLTPSKRRGRQSLLQIAVTSSAQKRQQQIIEEKSPSPDKLKRTPTRGGNRTPKSPRTPRTPQGSRLTLQTPKCIPKNSDFNGTPKTRRSLAANFESSSVPPTPKGFRSRLRSKIREVVYCSDEDFDELLDSDDDKEYKFDGVNSSENESELESSVVESTCSEDESPVKSAKRPSPQKRVVRNRKKLRADIDQVANNEDYFIHNDGSAALTSDHTLNKLSVPRLSGETLRTIIGDGVLSDHREEREALYREHLAMFDKWRTVLEHGFSVFLHGVGSKKKLLSHFQSEYLQEEDHIVVNGFFPSLTLKSIFTTILDELLEIDGAPTSVIDQLSYLYTHYSQENVSPLYIILHNIDGPMLRTLSVQKSLSHLCSLPSVRLIASVDHINAPLILDSDRTAEYNVLWFDATTLQPYLEETSYENSLLVQQSTNLALSSLIHVFKSLTPSTKGIYLLLTNYQLENQKDGSYAGLSFHDLYQRCRERMLVNSELTLRAQLIEFMDHKLLRQKKGHDGSENYIIPLESSTLKEFVEQQDEETT